jgi:hypothetical protein
MTQMRRAAVAAWLASLVAGCGVFLPPSQDDLGPGAILLGQGTTNGVEWQVSAGRERERIRTWISIDGQQDALPRCEYDLGEATITTCTGSRAGLVVVQGYAPADTAMVRVDTVAAGAIEVRPVRISAVGDAVVAYATALSDDVQIGRIVLLAADGSELHRLPMEPGWE